MRHKVLWIGAAGCLAGVVMLLVVLNSRELNDKLALYGALLSFVSLLVVFFARVFINNRD